MCLYSCPTSDRSPARPAAAVPHPGVHCVPLSLPLCRGTVRKVNEDRYDVKVVPANNADQGEPFAFAGVYDGHGQQQQQQHATATCCYLIRLL